MRHVFRPVLVAAMLSLLAVVPAAAAPPERFDERFTILFPDTTRGLVVLVNTTRDEYCTADVVAWELAVLQFDIDWNAWFEGGQVGPEPPFPADPPSGFPEGTSSIHTQVKETGQGALVFYQAGRNLEAEIWPMVENAPLIGPCTDTNSADTPWVGTANYSGNDNDRFGSGTRGNAFGDQGSIKGKDANGRPFNYSWRFHINSSCFAPENDGPPACLIDRSSFRTH